MGQGSRCVAAIPGGVGGGAPGSDHCAVYQFGMNTAQQLDHHWSPVAYFISVVSISTVLLSWIKVVGSERPESD